ncbi:hypothetical protein [Halorussus caseinilyticus]|uniref:Uncharacterized protein n=1 Tax=Halorussus caseinilyticus TaxID=3034025 RepID=A0ABD5WGY5_9EURY
MKEVLVSIEYVTIGDGGLSLCEGDSGGLVKFDIKRVGSEYLISHYSYPSSSYRLGTLAKFMDEETTRHLASGLLDTFRVSEKELNSILDVQFAPVEVDNKLYWSNEISLSDL